MDIELLKNAHDDIEMLKALSLPVSDEQLSGIAELEKRYLEENIIPTVKREIEPFLSSLRCPISLDIVYTLEKGLSFDVDGSMGNSEVASEDDASSRDVSKYSFDGSVPYNKRRFVLAVVKNYVKNNPYVTLDDLEKRFPSSLNHTVINGVVRNYDDILKKIEIRPDLRKRFFLKEEDIILLNDGTKVCVNNQWGSTFYKFLEVAEQLHTIVRHDG